MPSRVLDFPVFDVDNHMYETTDAFTKFLPREYEDYIRYVNVHGRTKIAIRNVISDYIPNPTFEVVAAPGAQELYFKDGNPEGKSPREIMGKAIRSIPAFRDPEPRLELMDELGIDRALMWPTLASLLEERLSDDPLGTHTVIHALNQWMHEHWTFNYQERIFPAPVVTLCIVDRAIEELGWLLERGARVILVSGPTALTPPAAAEITRVESAEQMLDATMSLLSQATIVIKAAAVSDYQAKSIAPQKIKRKGSITLDLQPTVDILKEISSHKQSQIVIGFAAETENVLENARQKLASKNLDAIVVNDVSREGIGFDSDRNEVTIITHEEVVEVPETTKWEVAQRVLDQAARLRQRRKATVKA